MTRDCRNNVIHVVRHPITGYSTIIKRIKLIKIKYAIEIFRNMFKETFFLQYQNVIVIKKNQMYIYYYIF